MATITVDKLAYSNSIWHKYCKMEERFDSEYNGTTNRDASKEKIRETIQKDQLRFIYLDKQVAGFVNFDIMGAYGSDEIFKTINCLYVKPQYRHQGVATQTRLYLLFEASDINCFGTVISLQRLYDRPSYWYNQGLKYFTIAPHNSIDPGVTIKDVWRDKKALIQLVNKIPNGDFPKDYWKNLDDAIKKEAE